jgi:hypothetical protein
MALRKGLADGVRRTLRAAGFRAVTKTVRGAPLRIPLAMGELRSMLFDPAYSPFFNEDEVMDVLDSRIRAEDVIFDIGAYHGVWAMLLARRAREVVAFVQIAGLVARRGSWCVFCSSYTNSISHRSWYSRIANRS